MSTRGQYVHGFRTLAPVDENYLISLVLRRIVHFMNSNESNRPAEMNALLMLDELASGEPISQREIAGRLGIALGLANAYLKTLMSKGYVQVKTCPHNRYAYLLTPTGVTEKSRYIYQQVTHYHQIFQRTRQETLNVFKRLYADGCREAVFCGVDEFTEIAYLSLREAQIKLVGVFDDQRAGDRLIDQPVLPLSVVAEHPRSPVIITALREPERYRAELLQLGVRVDDIYMPVEGFI